MIRRKSNHSRWFELMMRSFHIFVTLLSLITLSGCGSKDRAETGEDARLKIFVSIPPQAYFVERIGGDYASIRVLLKPGQSPHTFEPSPGQITDLSGADLYFTVGLPFEKTLTEKLKDRSAKLRIIPTDRGIERVAAHSGDEHRSSGEDDPHIWLSPPLIITQVTAITAALKETDPEHRDQYQQNLEDFLRDLQDLDQTLREVLKPYRGRAFYVFHPAFGYFAKAYGLKQEAVEIQGKSPSPKQLLDLINRAKAEGVKIIFIQPQFDPSAAQTLAKAIGGAVVPIDPLEKDVLANLRSVAQKIAEALQPQSVAL
jgi:zinc transport system substrate-binding protein